MEKQQRR
jgi:hypothetical protein